MAREKYIKRSGKDDLWTTEPHKAGATSKDEHDLNEPTTKVRKYQTSLQENHQKYIEAHKKFNVC